MIYTIPVVERKIWGGQFLETLKSQSENKAEHPVGETWELSTLPEGMNTVKNQGHFHIAAEEEETLKSYLKEELPYLVKFIDTSDVLSVQVHPDDQQASKENLTTPSQSISRGKTEAWLILSADVEAKIYLGLKEKVTLKELQESLNENKNVDCLLNEFNAQAGDIYWVPAGTVHAIGKGIRLLEIQQASGTTYRLWDWGRVDALTQRPRQLHIKEGLRSTRLWPVTHDTDPLLGLRPGVNSAIKASLSNLSTNGKEIAHCLQVSWSPDPNKRQLDLSFFKESQFHLLIEHSFFSMGIYVFQVSNQSVISIKRVDLPGPFSSSRFLGVSLLSGKTKELKIGESALENNIEKDLIFHLPDIDENKNEKKQTASKTLVFALFAF